MILGRCCLTITILDFSESVPSASLTSTSASVSVQTSAAAQRPTATDATPSTSSSSAASSSRATAASAASNAGSPDAVTQVMQAIGSTGVEALREGATCLNPDALWAALKQQLPLVAPFEGWAQIVINVAKQAGVGGGKTVQGTQRRDVDTFIATPIGLARRDSTTQIVQAIGATGIQAIQQAVTCINPDALWNVLRQQLPYLAPYESEAHVVIDLVRQLGVGGAPATSSIPSRDASTSTQLTRRRRRRNEPLRSFIPTVERRVVEGKPLITMPIEQAQPYDPNSASASASIATPVSTSTTAAATGSSSPSGDPAKGSDWTTNPLAPRPVMSAASQGDEGQSNSHPPIHRPILPRATAPERKRRATVWSREA